MLAFVPKSNTTSKSKKDGREGKAGSSTGTGSSAKGEADPMEELIKKGMTISGMLPLLLEVTNYKYTEIDELLANVPDDVFDSWLNDKCLDKK